MVPAGAAEPSKQGVREFRGRALPEPAWPVGYAALIERHTLRLPLPPVLTAVAERHHPKSSTDWRLVSPRHAPADTLAGHLEFALKHEGVNLAVLKALFERVPAAELAALVRAKPTGIYTRRVWFLHEWLTGGTLEVEDLGKVRAVEAVDPTQQVTLAKGALSARHRVLNNLPGTPRFCPMVSWTPALREAAARGLDARAREVIGRTHPDVIARAAAFLLLSDSRSSFHIEGEQPSRDRTQRWGQTIAEAGSRPLTIGELERLQRVLIGDDRFVVLGLRHEGGFVGTHDRRTNEPLPTHISARHEDLVSLLEGISAYDERANGGELDPVVAATAVAFGFVYVHPFVDGNGRIHRWLIHHVLARAGYSPAGVVFPVSAAILRNVEDYRRVLESYSRPLLPCIEWKPNEEGNVEVLNETADFYRFFDATAHAEFLYRCVQETVEKDLPEEVAYLEGYDRFASGVQRVVDMPARTVELLHRFLRQNDGRLSNRARTREFAALTDAEVEHLEGLYAACRPPARETTAG